MDRSAEAKKLERRFNTIYSRLTAENQ